MNTELTIYSGAAEPVESSSYQMSSYSDPDDWLWTALTGYAPGFGSGVNPTSALSHGPVWQAVNLLAGDMGQIPLHKMIRNGRDREKDRRHPLEWLINKQPNNIQTPQMWMEMMMASALLWGNGISVIMRDGAGRPAELVPLLPDRTSYEEDEQGQFWIMSWIKNQPLAFRAEDTIHIRNLPTNTFWGVSCVSAAKKDIEYGIQIRDHGTNTFKNQAVPRGVITHPGKLTLEARENLRKEWNAQHQGPDHTGKVALLAEAASWNPLTISNQDAQWFEAAKLNREQVASLFGLPAHKLNALENMATRANVEQQNQSYLQQSLSRWFVRFTQELERKLLRENERRSGDHWFKFFPEAFLRADTQARFEAYSKAISSRWMSPNEVREKEDMNPYEGGDSYLNPAIDLQESNPDLEGSAMEAMRGNMEAMLRNESHRIIKAAKQGGNFLEWLDGFYDKYVPYAAGYLEHLGNHLISLGMSCRWEEACLSHAEDQRRQLLRAADVPPSQFLEAVAMVADDTNEKINLLCKEMRDGKARALAG